MPIITKKELPDIGAIARNWAKYKGTSLKAVSRKLKRNPEFLRQSFASRDPRPSVLLALSDFLGENLFEYYLALLPENIRPTAREKELQQEIEELKKELEQVKTERDKYWDVISGNR